MMRKIFVLAAAFLIWSGTAFCIVKLNKRAVSSCLTARNIQNDSEFTIMPGAISKELTLSFPETAAGAAITITDASGAKVLSKTIETGTVKATINVAKLTAGSYFIVFTSGEYRSSKLFIKQ